MQYFYEATDAAGTPILGKMEGNSETEVKAKLQQLGYQVQSLAPVTAVSQAPAPVDRSDRTMMPPPPSSPRPQVLEEEDLPVLIGSRPSLTYRPLTPQAPIMNASQGTVAARKPAKIVLAGNAERTAPKSIPRTSVRPVSTAFQQQPTLDGTSKLAGVSTKDLMMFFRQLGSLIQSGMTAYSALDNLAPRTPNKNLRQVATEMTQAAHDGKQISGVMFHYPAIIPYHIAAMVAAAETGGFLEIAFTEIAYSFEENMALYKHSWIPKFLAINGWYTLVTMYPFGHDLYQNFNLVNNIKIAAVQSLFIYLPLALLGHWLFVMIGRRLRKPQYKQMLDNLSLKIPVFGKLQREASLSSFLRILRRLYNSGIAPGTAWECAMNTSSNMVIRGRLAEAQNMIQHGSSLPEAFTATNLFESDVEQMMHTAQASGQVVEMLDQATAQYVDMVAISAKRAKILMFRIGLNACLILSGAALIYFTYMYFHGMFGWVDKYFGTN